MVFTDLERGAVAVVKSMGRETSKTVGHKYGEDAGKVADDSMTAAAHGINLAYVRVNFPCVSYLHALSPASLIT